MLPEATACVATLRLRRHRSLQNLSEQYYASEQGLAWQATRYARTALLEHGVHFAISLDFIPTSLPLLPPACNEQDVQQESDTWLTHAG